MKLYKTDKPLLAEVPEKEWVVAIKKEYNRARKRRK